MNGKKIPQIIYKVAMPVAFIVIGALLFFVSAIQSIIFVYLFGAALIISGSAVAVQYFAKQLYKSYESNDFTVGVFMLILGICIIIGAKKIADSVIILLGICLLLSAIMKLQSVFQFKLAGSKFWIPILCFSVAVLAAAMVILIALEWKSRDKFTYITMIVDGVLSIVSNIATYCVMKKRYQKQEPAEIPVQNELPPVEL